jgi:hypothetical protein
VNIHEGRLGEGVEFSNGKPPFAFGINQPEGVGGSSLHVYRAYLIQKINLNMVCKRDTWVKHKMKIGYSEVESDFLQSWASIVIS